MATPRGLTQCHLVTTVDQVQIVDRTSENVGPVTLAQIREVNAHARSQIALIDFFLQSQLPQSFAESHDFILTPPGVLAKLFRGFLMPVSIAIDENIAVEDQRRVPRRSVDSG